MSPRKAVVLVHGMGNQVPLTSIREFVEIFKPNNEQLYSSPDRIMGDFETRRFSYSKEGIDYYEFYWAHLMKEPTMSDIIIWSFKLIFCKDLSDRARIPIYILRVLLSALVVYIGYLVIHYGNKILEANELINAVLSGIGIFLVYKILFPAIKSMLSNVIVQSMGDVIRYTIPSPQNIEVRNKIRKKGVELLKGLHDAKNENGKDKYSEIILVGHSLGSIVGYDLLTFLFPNYNNEYIYKGQHDQDAIKSFASKDFTLETPPYATYQEEQEKVMINFRKFELKWKFSNFITLGSPLTHAVMLIANNKIEFEKRKSIREFPTCPPIADNQDQFYYFYEHGPNKFLVPNHAAFFTMTKWTNIYFKNDLIGGSIQNIFGKGIYKL